LKRAAKSHAVILRFSILRIWMSRAVRSWPVTLGTFGEAQWGEPNYSLDTLYFRPFTLGGES
jgi:hypothetical protein